MRVLGKAPREGICQNGTSAGNPLIPVMASPKGHTSHQTPCTRKQFACSCRQDHKSKTAKENERKEKNRNK